MNDNKKYNSFTIPSREQFEKSKTDNIENIKQKITAKFNYNPFVEIEMNEPDHVSKSDTISEFDISSESDTNSEISTNSYSASFSIPQPQPINPINNEPDEKRAMFYAMHKIGRDNMSFNNDNSREFYYQGLYMKDFEDDYNQQVEFSSYFPYYDQMNYEQLRTYFTWRTEVRNGNIENTSLSYAYLYIYELINNIGVDSPEDGLNRLLIFWMTFREYNSCIDKYVLQWIKDYHVYYPVEKSFVEFASENDLQMYYPTIFGYESDKDNSFDIFSGISRYNIKKSIFYNEETKKIINDCFYYILTKIRELYKKHNKCFEEIIFYPLSSGSIWTPFNRALFYPAYEQQDRQVVISRREVYSCKLNVWMYKSVILSDLGRDLIGYMMKEMEASLRKTLNFKHKLVANADSCNKVLRKDLKNTGIILPDFIQKSVSEFYALATRKKITVDISNLKQIRQEALEIQEKLIVPEETENIELNKQKQTDVAEQQEITEQIADIEQISLFGSSAANLGPWDELKNSFTQIELEAIDIILHDKDIKAFALKNMIMLEVLIDGINEKAMDFIGDTVMELDSNVTIYDDYREKLMEMVG